MSKYEQWEKGMLPGVENPWDNPDVWSEYLAKCNTNEESFEFQSFEEYMKQFITPKIRWKQIGKAQRLMRRVLAEESSKNILSVDEDFPQEEVPF